MKLPSICPHASCPPFLSILGPHVLAYRRFIFSVHLNQEKGARTKKSKASQRCKHKSKHMSFAPPDHQGTERRGGASLDTCRSAHSKKRKNHAYILGKIINDCTMSQNCSYIPAVGRKNVFFVVFCFLVLVQRGVMVLVMLLLSEHHTHMGVKNPIIY